MFEEETKKVIEEVKYLKKIVEIGYRLHGFKFKGFEEMKYLQLTTQRHLLRIGRHNLPPLRVYAGDPRKIVKEVMEREDQ